MRAARALTGTSLSADHPWLPGLPHAALGLTTVFAFGFQACLTGLLLATLASFVVFLPLTALALNRGQAIAPGTPAPVLTLKAQAVLLVLWTLAVWAGAALAR
ncbi:MAG TPA: hypothetical protein VHB27_18790 [Rhodopila sp.]|uniref:hypothetical protein n=1 Tax=Rhodopila sp. TaxID=2480087 RepID=UPI002C1DAF90|nr:hypothetical protein [Rhodopila sp.]HVY17278.1 hypothetical protein [Rhodopila sp.]